jgi:hypothetical protein
MPRRCVLQVKKTSSEASLISSGSVDWDFSAGIGSCWACVLLFAVLWIGSAPILHLANYFAITRLQFRFPFPVHHFNRVLSIFFQYTFRVHATIMSATPPFQG